MTETTLAYHGGMVEVKWIHAKSRSDSTQERWRARLVKPWESCEFAWLVRRRDGWHLELMTRDLRIRDVAVYRTPEHAMRHVDRWIASRWMRTVRANDEDDPRGRTGRRQSKALRHWLAVLMHETETSVQATQGTVAWKVAYPSSATFFKTACACRPWK